MYGSNTDPSISTLPLLLDKKLAWYRVSIAYVTPAAWSPKGLMWSLSTEEGGKQRVAVSSVYSIGDVITKKTTFSSGSHTTKKYGNNPGTDSEKKHTNIFKNPPYRYKLHPFHL